MGEERQQADEQLDELHHRYGAELRRYVARRTDDPQLAEDLVQETLLRAWRSRIDDDPGDSIRPWLYTVAKRLVIDNRRSAWHRRERASETLPEQAESDRMDALFDGLLVRECLQTLADHHRSVVILAYYRQLSIAEIATRLEIAEGTVKSRLHYGLRALRLALQERGVIT